MTNIDTARLRADIKRLNDQIRPCKEALRSTWTRPMADKQYELLSLREDITELYCLLAWTRGRSHLVDAERSTEIAERMASEYSVEAA
jgi:hypothetical protein